MEEEIKLTKFSSAAGCGAKLPPDILRKAIETLPTFENENLLVGTENSDDAAVYKLIDDLALIQTLDFFTPIDDDPYYYGLIAATNALSDVYAMGGKPIVALNIVAFPVDLDFEILTEILRGGADKVKEAGACLVGGHTIKDKEPKYGLSVSGLVNPNKILKNFGSRNGDILILTKPLGSGLISTANKLEEAKKSDIEQARRVMTTLNKNASEVIEKYDIHACTDVTGFGLACHALEMAQGNNKEIHITTNTLKIIGDALEYSKNGFIPGGTYTNKRTAKDFLTISNDVDEATQNIVFDPQTSGGLLISINEKDLNNIMEDFKVRGMEKDVSVVGYVKESSDKGKIVIE